MLLLNTVFLADSYSYFETQSKVCLFYGGSLGWFLCPSKKTCHFFWSIFLFFDIRCLKTCLVFSPSEPWNQLLLREALIYSWMVFRNQYLGARYAYSPGVSLLISPRNGHMYIIYTIRTNPHAQACSYLVLYLCISYIKNHEFILILLILVLHHRVHSNLPPLFFWTVRNLALIMYNI